MGYNMNIQAMLYLTFTSCVQTPTTVTISNPLPACEEYVQDENIYGYCVYQKIDTLLDINSVNLYCTQTGTWQDNCHQAWVMSQVDNRTLEDLLPICGDDSDCSLELLDSKHHDDVLEQINLCLQYTNHYARDCVMHAIQYWYFTWPTADEMSIVAKQSSQYPEQVGMYLGARVGCDGIGNCLGDPEIQTMCERYVDIFQDESKCPNQHRNRRWKGRRRTDGAKTK
jgi:hypothetical protein